MAAPDIVLARRKRDMRIAKKFCEYFGEDSDEELPWLPAPKIRKPREKQPRLSRDSKDVTVNSRKLPGQTFAVQKDQSSSFQSAAPKIHYEVDIRVSTQRAATKMQSKPPSGSRDVTVNSFKPAAPTILDKKDRLSSCKPIALKPHDKENRRISKQPTVPKIHHFMAPERSINKGRLIAETRQMYGAAGTSRKRPYDPAAILEQVSNAKIRKSYS